ncbi:MAG: membrane protein insertion efficiency factor YidD [Oscillospiraceae bacterium]|nr:membrane protein insertion efficiency factor YidD [Oscillospiraceae bacterium]
MKYLFLGIIKLYRLTLSKILPPACRFSPSCSEYATTAIRRFGAVKGGYLALWRIIRCNPFSHGGYDPVPEKFCFRPDKVQHYLPDSECCDINTEDNCG